MSIFVDNLGALASLIGSLTVVGSALLWIYNKFIGAPREKKRLEEELKRQTEMLELITERNTPLIEAIDNLKEWSEEGLHDRKQLHKITDETTLRIGEHELRLDDHSDRILILETTKGLTKEQVDRLREELKYERNNKGHTRS